jgi:hypothetical protein
MTDIVKDDYNPRIDVDVTFDKGSKDSVSVSTGLQTVTVDVTDINYDESVQQPELRGAVAGSDIEVLNIEDNGDGTSDVTVENETGGPETVDVVVQGLFIEL